jgi:hypothetical protein
MRRFSVFGGGLAIVLVGLTGACGSDPVSKVPTGPSAPGVVGLQISGPASVAPGQSAQFIADTRLSDGAVKTTTSAANIRWRSSNPALMQVSTSGVVTAGQTRGEAILTAEVLPTSTIRGTMEVVIIPDGTYRLVGSVRESEAPTQGISGARVEVTGSSLSTTTDVGGNYRLYGVPPSAEIRVTANGYQTVTQNVQLTEHTTQNFLLPLAGPRLSLNGSFDVLFDVVGSCSGSPPLSADLYHRSYEANVTTTGSLVDVQLTEPRFRLSGSKGNRFTGRADPAGIKFTLDYGFYYGYLYDYPSVLERLSNDTYFIVYGTAATTSLGSGVSGQLNGAFANYDSRFPASNTRLVGFCFSNQLRLTLSPR